MTSRVLHIRHLPGYNKVVSKSTLEFFSMYQYLQVPASEYDSFFRSYMKLKRVLFHLKVYK
jgi:hypothetical protein